MLIGVFLQVGVYVMQNKCKHLRMLLYKALHGFSYDKCIQNKKYPLKGGDKCKQIDLKMFKSIGI